MRWQSAKEQRILRSSEAQAILNDNLQKVPAFRELLRSVESVATNSSYSSSNNDTALIRISQAAVTKYVLCLTHWISAEIAATAIRAQNSPESKACHISQADADFLKAHTALTEAVRQSEPDAAAPLWFTRILLGHRHIVCKPSHSKTHLSFCLLCLQQVQAGVLVLAESHLIAKALSVFFLPLTQNERSLANKGKRDLQFGDIRLDDLAYNLHTGQAALTKDGDFHMLCKTNLRSSCEDMFGRWEKIFKEGLWLKLLKAVKENGAKLSYDNHFCRFAESLAWRMLLAHADLSLPDVFVAARQLQDALQQDSVSDTSVEMYVLLASHHRLNTGGCQRMNRTFFMPFCKLVARDYVFQGVTRPDVLVISLGVIHIVIVLQPDDDKDKQEPNSISACVRQHPQVFQRVSVYTRSLHVTPSNQVPTTYLRTIREIADVDEQSLKCESTSSQERYNFCREQRIKKELLLPQDVQDAFLFGMHLEHWDQQADA